MGGPSNVELFKCGKLQIEMVDLPFISKADRGKVLSMLTAKVI